MVSWKVFLKDPASKTFLGTFYLDQDLRESVYVRSRAFYISSSDPAHSVFHYMLLLLGYEIRIKPLTEVRPRIDASNGKTIELELGRSNQI